MAKQLQLRRGTTAQMQNFTGAVGEITFDTERKVVVAHDGVKQGGYPLVSELELDIKNDNGVLKKLDGSALRLKVADAENDDEAVNLRQFKNSIQYIDGGTIEVVASDDMTLLTGNVDEGKYLVFISLVSDETYDKGGDNDDVSIYFESSNDNVLIYQTLDWLRPESSKDNIRESGGSELIFMEVPKNETSKHSIRMSTDRDSTFGGYVYWKIIRIGE